MVGAKVGDRVQVTDEYAAWYRERTAGYLSMLKPEDVLIIEAIDDDGYIRIREADERVPTVGWTLPEYLVSAESEDA